MSSRVSRRYAKALLSLGQEDGQYARYGQELQEYGKFCAANGEYHQVVSNRIYPVEERKRVLDAVLGRSSLSDLIKNFLRLLVDKNRIGVVGEITDHYLHFMDEISNITRARIRTARPLKEKALEDLVKALEGMTGKEVRAAVEVDASLIGGVLVRIGDTVLDGSVKAQLEGLKESLKRGEYI